MILEHLDDIGEVLGRCLDENGIVLSESEISPAFFDLRTRIAGELFQKITNYHTRLAIVLQDPGKYGNRFSELAYEHRNHPYIRFFAEKKQAKLWLTEGG